MTDTTDNSQIYLLFGRLEGKVDTIIQSQTAHSSRLDKVESKQAEHDVWRAQMEAKGNQNKGWWHALLSIGALGLSALSALKGFFF
ncbi:hypothetical protein [Labrys neptuniae]